MEGILISEAEVRSNKYTLSDREFSFICKLVYDSTGIVLDERKREMVYRRLMRRTRELRLDSFSDYCKLLKNEEALELPNFTNAITTNLTSFFRESHHFDYMRDVMLPDMLKQQRRESDGRRLRIWSSACSTGEEPYSTAITLLEAMGPEMSSWDARILATDLDSNVVATGNAGVYKEDRIKDLDSTLKRKWFHRGVGDNHGFVKVDKRMSNLITFKTLNLLHDWPMQGPFDVIFCRNVMIYFDKETQYKLILRYFDLLRPGGLLFLGHSESMPKEIKQFEFLGKTIFRRPD